MKKNAAFFFVVKGSNDAWTTQGFSSRNKFKNVSEHERGVNIFHNNVVMMKCDSLMKTMSVYQACFA